MHKPNQQPTTKELRNFGFISSLIFVTLFGIIIPLLLNNNLPQWPWFVATGLTTWAVLHPTSLRFIYQPWIKFGLFLGKINSRIILGLMFYFIVTPIGLLMRLRGKALLDPIDKSANSYKIREEQNDKQHMEHPY